MNLCNDFLGVPTALGISTRISFTMTDKYEFSIDGYGGLFVFNVPITGNTLVFLAPSIIPFSNHSLCTSEFNSSDARYNAFTMNRDTTYGALYLKQTTEYSSLVIVGRRYTI